MPMKFVLGIDSGGTNYRVVASDLEGNRLGSYVGQPANLHYLGPEELLRRIEENISQCLELFSGKREDIEYLVCGTTGIDSEENAAEIEGCYRKLDGICCPMKIINDAELAHYTVTGGRGVLIISGTGSIAYGTTPDGRTGRAGGWPLSILGDEGSGTWVTKMALRHFGRWLDGAVERTAMVEKISSEFAIHTRNDLIRTALAGGKNPAGFPPLGGLVNQAAKEGDPYAERILTGAAMELFHIIEDIVSALKLEEAEPDFCIGVWGSNLVKSEIVLGRFSELIRKRYPKAQICLPVKEAVDGAVDMAVQLLQKRNEEKQKVEFGKQKVDKAIR